MTVQQLETLFTFIGGLGMFLYGMNVMADGLQKAAGSRLKNLLRILTSNRLLAVLVGAGVTAIIQSSSATTVMIVGFVNAGIMNLGQAIGVIMGANIGTTMTGWLVSMKEWGALLLFCKPEFIAPCFIGIGAFLTMLAKKSRTKDIGEIMVGFGILFVGISFLSNAIAPYKDAPIFSKIFTVLGKNPILAILAGAVVTGIIQSSSASIGILQTLAMNGMVAWNSAIFITLGQNIGTCVTALLSSINTSRTAKRAAVMHLLFNVVGAVGFGFVMFFLFRWNPVWASSKITMVQISIFHTIFNVVNTIVLFPFANGLVYLSGVLLPEQVHKPEKTELESFCHLDERILETPSFAMENVLKEMIHMGEMTIANFKRAMQALFSEDQNAVQQVYTMEKQIDYCRKKITEFLIQLSNVSLTEEQHLIVNHLFYTVSDIERVGDHSENLAELAEEKIKNGLLFPEEIMIELKQMYGLAFAAFEHAIEARKNGDSQDVGKVVKLEERVDQMEAQLREKQIQRLSKSHCSAEAGMIVGDVLMNLERISDHSYNIVNYVKAEQEKR